MSRWSFSASAAGTYTLPKTVPPFGSMLTYLGNNEWAWLTDEQREVSQFVVDSLTGKNK